MTIKEEIQSIVDQLIKGYDKHLVDRLHLLRLKEKEVKEANIQRPRIYQENIVILER